MSTEENKAIVRQFLDAAFNRVDLTALEKVTSPDFINHAAPPEMQQGWEGLKRVVEMLHTAFPDQHLEIEEIFAEGEMVAVRSTYSGTQLGTYRDIAPTAKHFTRAEMHILRLAGGQVVEHWAVRDELSQLQQLGLLPGFP